MPLYIDLHIDNGLTPDIVRQCHVADKTIQEKYGVKYLQILLNQPQGYLFCLVEGPDKESCARVHQEAHGNIACNILEITESDFSALLAGKKKDAYDFTLNADKTFDTGIRTILVVNLLGPSGDPWEEKKVIRSMLDQRGGKTAVNFENKLAGIFQAPSSALEAAMAIGEYIDKKESSVEIRMGIHTGSPLEQSGTFFENAIRLAERFSFVSDNGQITVSSKVMQLCDDDMIKTDNRIKIIQLPTETFLNNLLDCAEKIWDKNDTTISSFAIELGMSRSQLARKLQAFTGLSPNDLLKEFRLRKAVRLMESGTMNVAEITMAIGFSNPSYFTKCFRERFGRVPSDYSLPA